LKKVVIVYGSSTGNTETVAERIADNLSHEVEIHDVASSPIEAIKNADLVLFGSSTWGNGDLQDDFEDFIDELTPELLNGKDVAVFGCGDEDSYPDEFCAATDIIRDKASEAGANIVADNLRIDNDPDDHEDEIVAFAEQF
jgi:flavodoxin I